MLATRIAVADRSRVSADGREAVRFAATGALAMVFVGGSAAVASQLVPAPLFTAQAVRYAAALLLLVSWAHASGQRVTRPQGREWWLLVGVAFAGLVLFNVALVDGSRDAEPAVLAVAVACAPLALAVVGPLLEGGRLAPAPTVLAAAFTVTGGAVLVGGFGHASLGGLGWAVVIFLCESGFTLLAVPVLGRHGPWGVSIHATWMATAAFAVLGVLVEGPTAVLRLDTDEYLAISYLAVAVTAIAFVCWYSCVRHLGAGRAGLLIGVVPLTAAAVGCWLGGQAPSLFVWVGTIVVGAGLVLGLAHGRTGQSRHPEGP